MSVGTISYRTSHLSRGADYHRRFADNPRRRTLWKIEQERLRDIIGRFSPEGAVEHLDFACGTGRILGAVERHVTRSTGVDVSAAMLDVARQVASRSELIEADLTRDDVLAERQFDLITAFRFFPNAEPELRREVMSVLIRHLNDDGVLVFNNHRSTGCLRDRIVRIVTAGRRGHGGMAPADAKALIQSAGLRIVAVYHAGLVPEYEQILLRPRWLVDAVERVAARLPIAALAENVIYVCRK